MNYNNKSHLEKQAVLGLEMENVFTYVILLRNRINTVESQVLMGVYIKDVFFQKVTVNNHRLKINRCESRTLL